MARIHNNKREETESLVQSLTNVKSDAVLEVKRIREMALNVPTKNSGVCELYDQNYIASVALLGGSGDTEIMKDGRTATDYITGMASRFDETPEEYALYIINENHNVAGPAMIRIEEKYLALCYAGDSETTPINSLETIDEVNQAVDDYRTFCGS